MRKQLYVAAERSEEVTIILRDGGTINGVATVSTDPDRAKVICFDGAVWIPYNEITHVNRVIQLKKNVTPK
ncbi:hypothetical protein [Paenibacillus wynnii]|uniref:Uncharacterized protein n=1 Tax=Paenibacillus wynnii TaxID=268407 RepID=A0A098M4S1_9BACL|nr:hypothetical protein [Paenibacillus wynnii]KGE17549.1 hypothetical protein PWYN_23400 [Paenibacillus wynnii]